MEAFLLEYGVWGIASFVLGDDLGLPFFPPGTMIFGYATLAHYHPELKLWPIILIALTIPPFANYCLFFAGKYGLRHYIEEHGHKFYLPTHRLQKAAQIMKKHGEKTIFFTACWSTIRPFCSFMAGSLGMNTFKFMIYHFLGVCIWASFFIGGGYYFGDDIWFFIQNNWRYAFIILLISISCYFYWSSFIPRKK